MSQINFNIFLGKKAEDLSNLINHQSVQLFKSLNINVPVKSTSLILNLYQYKILSVIEIAEKLNHSRQLIIQKLPKLTQLDLIQLKTDQHDKRRKLYTLTSYGTKQAEQIIELQAHLNHIYQRLYQEIELDLFTGLEKAIKSLTKEHLINRYRSFVDKKNNLLL